VMVEQVSSLLRQVYVVVVAAVETYGADRVIELATRYRLPAPASFSELPPVLRVTLDDGTSAAGSAWWKSAGLKCAVRQFAGAAPSQLSQLLGAVGVNGIWEDVDRIRKLEPGTSRSQLQHIVDKLPGNLVIDVRVEQYPADLPERLCNVLFGDPSLAAQFAQHAIQFPAQIFKHESYSSGQISTIGRL